MSPKEKLEDLLRTMTLMSTDDFRYPVPFARAFVLHEGITSDSIEVGISYKQYVDKNREFVLSTTHFIIIKKGNLKDADIIYNQIYLEFLATCIHGMTSIGVLRDPHGFSLDMYSISDLLSKGLYNNFSKEYYQIKYNQAPHRKLPRIVEKAKLFIKRSYGHRKN